MRGKLLVVALGMVLAPMSAWADMTPRGAVSVGLDLGRHDHPDDEGASLGVGLDAELGLGIFTVGGSIGYDDYAPLHGVPVHSSTVAGRAGVDVPLGKTTNSAGRTIQFGALGALEAGLHNYSPEGERKEFLGGTTTYAGEGASIKFVGARIGTAMTIRRQGWRNGVVFKLELVGRRDLGRADLEYDETDCGGLFLDDNECSDTTRDMTRVGGTELGVTTSIGVVFGG